MTKDPPADHNNSAYLGVVGSLSVSRAAAGLIRVQDVMGIKPISFLETHMLSGRLWRCGGVGLRLLP